MPTSIVNPPIAGVSPPDLRESVIMTVWPSIAAMSIGRLLGRMYEINWGYGFVTVGKLLALLTAPLAAAIVIGRFATSLKKELPFIGWLAKPIPLDAWRYVLTNRRVLVQKGLLAVDESWVELDRFDTIEVEIEPGQAWYQA